MAVFSAFYQHTLDKLDRERSRFEAALAAHTGEIIRLTGEVGQRDLAITQRDAEVSRLHREIAERDGTIMQRDADRLAGDRLIASLSQATAEQDQSAAQLRTSHAESLAQLEASLAARDAQIARIHHDAAEQADAIQRLLRELDQCERAPEYMQLEAHCRPFARTLRLVRRRLAAFVSNVRRKR